MKKADQELLQLWLDDPSFINWVLDHSSHDFRIWEHWLDNHPDKRELADVGSCIIRGIEFKKDLVSKSWSEASLSQVFNRIERNEKLQKPNKIKFLKKKSTILTIAASLLFLLGTVLVYFFGTSDHLLIAVSTNYGEKLEMTLPDQTHVVLNANSRLEYDKSNPRHVFLQGEAFFEVMKKPETNEKFLVTTSDLTIEVLGTAFNVNTHHQKTQVFLEEGKVQLDLETPDETKIEMEPGDLYTYSKSNVKKPMLEQTRSEASRQTSWTDGTIEFEDQTVENVLLKLTEIYGFEITSDSDELLKRRIIAGIPIDNEEIALEILEKVMDVKVRKTNGTISLIPLKGKIN